MASLPPQPPPSLNKRLGLKQPAHESSKERPTLREVNPEQLKEMIQGCDRLLVIDCFRDCKPCEDFRPVLEACAVEFAATAVFVRINVDKHPSVQEHLAVIGVPTFVFAKHTKLVGKFMGANEAKFRKALTNDGRVGDICGVTAEICGKLPCAVQ